MQNQLFTNPQSSYQHPTPALHNIFSQKRIVQSYPHKLNPHILFDPRHKSHHHSYHPTDMLVQHQPVDEYHRKPKRFVEDDLLQEFHSGNIVENYMMMDEKDEHFQHYENVFKGRGDKPTYLNENMLASSSENNDVPSRNSSLSSLSEKNQFVNINKSNNKSFLDEEFCDGKGTRNHVKTSHNINKKAHASHHNHHYYRKGNSENQMDLQNSAHEHHQSPYHVNENHFTVQNPPSFLINPKHHTTIELPRNNAFLSPQKKSTIATFRRMDIDEERQKKEKLLKIEKIQQMGCNCKKSKCLKMYCECFNLQIFCNENCNCVGCCNQESNEEHRKAVLDALTRNPKAFNEAQQKLEATFELGVQLAEVKKGCKCKKTKCQKKYCECFNIGEKCGKFCKCEGCENC